MRFWVGFLAGLLIVLLIFMWLGGCVSSQDPVYGHYLFPCKQVEPSRQSVSTFPS